MGRWDSIGDFAYETSHGQTQVECLSYINHNMYKLQKANKRSDLGCGQFVNRDKDIKKYIFKDELLSWNHLYVPSYVLKIILQ